VCDEMTRGRDTNDVERFADEGGGTAVGHNTPGVAEVRYKDQDFVLKDGAVVIAAITSCTNTSNPSVMVAAGLLAKKAVEKGLKVNPMIKTSLAPGSRVVTDYLEKAGLQDYLDQLGFNLVAYGCTTCIGNSGPLDEKIEKSIHENDLVVSSVLSGNRNFEARVHSSVKANFLMSPPLVVAYALAGTIDKDLSTEPVGYSSIDGSPVQLKDIWPSHQEIHEVMTRSLTPDMFTERYSRYREDNPLWDEVEGGEGDLYAWDETSTYIQQPPYFEGFTMQAPGAPELKQMRALTLFGDSVTTDHISPAGAFSKESPAGQYLVERGVEPRDFNSYGSRRGNDQVMVRGTFGNVRVRNELAQGREGGFTQLMPERELMSIYQAGQEYAKRQTPLIVFAGEDYGMGSSRDWAAKGTALLGVRAVVAKSFERIHRSNLIGMGVLPLQFTEGESYASLGIDGSETFTIEGLADPIQTGQTVTLKIQKEDGSTHEATLIVRLDTPIEIDYYLHGGILPYVLRQLCQDESKA